MIDDPVLAKAEEAFNPEPPTEWPVLSSAALPGLAGQFVVAACKDSEADPAAVLATFLGRFGIEASASPYFRTGETKHAPRINSVIVGHSSKARKGTSAGPVKAVFTGIDGCKTSPGPLSSGEGLIFAVRNPRREWIVNKKTGEGKYVITDPGESDKRLFVLDEEFSNALNAAKREGNTLSGIIRGLYDDGDAAPLTKTSRIETTGAHVGIVAHTTLAELKAKLTENEYLNGFGNRFLWVCARRQKLVPNPEPIPDSLKVDLREKLQKRLQHAFRGTEYRFSGEARELWEMEYPRLSMAHSGLAGCMVNRGEAHVVRLSLIYALLAMHEQIERPDLEAALAFWQYCQDSALYLFGGEQDDRRKTKIVNTLIPLFPQGMTKTEIANQIFKKHITSETLDLILTDLSKNNIIKIQKVSDTGGAPRTVVFYNALCGKSGISGKTANSVGCSHE